jgi:uncharacterized membrane protein YesL
VVEAAVRPLEVLRLSFRDWWRNWLHLSVLNLVWVLAWASVVLGPPVTLAAHAYVLRLVREDEMPVAEFVREVRANVGRGWAWALPQVALVAVFLVNMRFFEGFDGAWARVLELATVALLALWWLVQLYALPFLFVQERRSLPLAWRNATYTLLASPAHGLALGVAALALVLVSVQLRVLVFLATPVWLALIGTHAVLERLRRFGVTAA